jgi:RHS repeat-associated protein
MPFKSGTGLSETGENLTSTLSMFDFADVNSDGVTDLVQVIPGNVRVWPSGGWGFEEPVDWPGPTFRSTARVLLVDMNGNGSSDVVILDPQSEDGEQIKVLDCFPSGRGNLLSSIDNGLGGVTTIEYRSLTDYYLASIETDYPWESVSPIPVHVVSRISSTNSLDLDQDGENDLSVTEIIYRDPYYDGREKQFRGLASVTKIEWGDDLAKKSYGTATTVTRRRYHTGAPSRGNSSQFNHVAGADEEALRGKLLWEELCGIDSIDRNEESTFAWPKVNCQGDGLDNDGDGATDNETELAFCSDDLVYRRTVNRWKLRRLYDNESAPAQNNYPAKNPLRVVRDAQIDTEQIQSIEGPNVVKLALSERDRNPPRLIETEFEFNEFGGMIRKTEYGVVSPNHAKDSARTNLIEYAHHGAAFEQWTLDRVARSTHSDKGGKIVRAERHFYGDTSNKFDVLPLFSIGSRALKIRTDALLIPNSQDGLPKDKIDDDSNWVQRSIQGYDPFGNVTWLLDGMADSSNPQKGHSRTLEYDPIFNAFPISEIVYVADGKQLRAKASFDVSFGVMTSLVDFLENDEVELQDTVAGETVGQPRTVKGAATLLRYDSHARLTKLIRPGDSLEKPTEEYAYIPADPINKLQYSYDSTGGLTLRSTNGDWTVSLGEANGSVKLDEGLSAVVTLKREKSGELETVGSVSLTDGLGHSLAKVSESTNERNLFLESYLLDVRGNASQRMQPHENDGWRPTTQARRQLFKRDPLGRVYQTYHPADSNGVLATSSTIYLPQTRRVYDEEDNLLGGKHEGTFTDFEDDGFNRMAKVTQYLRLDDEGHSTNQLNSWQTVYEYDLLDNLVAVTDAQKNVSYHRYDSLGRRRTINDPDRGVATFEYDLADNLLLKTDARDAKIRIEYDGANRKLTEAGSYHGQTDSIAFHYDTPKQGLKDPSGAPLQPANCLGRLAWVEDLAGEEHFSYTPRGTVNWTLRRFNAEGENRVYFRAEEYDAQDRRTSQKVVSHDGKQLDVVSQYNKRGLIQSLDIAQAPVVGFDYHPNGVVSTTNNANGTKKHVELDHRLRLRHLQVTSPNGGNQQKLIDNEYSYDQASNLLRIDDLRPPTLVPLGDPLRNTQVFSLDDAYRLRSANYFTGDTKAPAVTKVDYGFDRIGNRLEKTATGALPDDPFWRRGLGKSVNASRSNRNGATVGQPGPHAVTSTDGGSILTFDNAGAATNYDGNTLIRDAWGRIRRVVDAAGNENANYRYSHNGERLLKITNDRIRYPFPEVRDSANAGLQYFIMNGDERLVCIEGGKRFFQHRDQMGSLILTTDSNAAVVEEINYLPYGAIRSQKVDAASEFTSLYRFSGNEYDAESGMHFFRNRSLIAGLGTFASCDPVIVSQKHKYVNKPLSQNPYLYSLGNPGTYTDPNGDIAFIPIVLGIYYAADFTMTVVDTVDSIQTIADPNASTTDKFVSVIGLAAGIVLPGAGYGESGKVASHFLEKLSKAGEAVKTVSKNPEKSLTRAGRALQKVVEKKRGGPGSFPIPHGGNDQINELGQFVLDDILTHPQSTYTKIGEGALKVTHPEGRVARFDPDGSLSGFIHGPRK